MLETRQRSKEKKTSDRCEGVQQKRARAASENQNIQNAIIYSSSLFRFYVELVHCKKTMRTRTLLLFLCNNYLTTYYDYYYYIIIIIIYYLYYFIIIIILLSINNANGFND